MQWGCQPGSLTVKRHFNGAFGLQASRLFLANPQLAALIMASGVGGVPPGRVSLACPCLHCCQQLLFVVPLAEGQVWCEGSDASLEVITQVCAGGESCL